MEASLLRHTLSQICQAFWRPLSALHSSVNRQCLTDAHINEGAHEVTHIVPVDVASGTGSVVFVSSHEFFKHMGH